MERKKIHLALNWVRYITDDIYLCFFARQPEKNGEVTNNKKAPRENRFIFFRSYRFVC